MADHVLAETTVEFGVGAERGGGSPEIVEGALEGEAVHVVKGDPAGFDRLAMVDGGKADRAVDDDHAHRMIKQRGEGLVVDVEDAPVQAELFGKAGDELRIVVVTTVEGVVLEDDGCPGSGMGGEGTEDHGDEAVHALVLGVNEELGIGGHLERDQKIPAGKGAG